MSRIYEDKALANRPVIAESVPGGWEPAQMQRGPGVVLEGKLRAISRHQIIKSGKSTHRYFILYIEPTRIHKRQFDSAGVEIEPNFSETKMVNTGYLMSSFKNTNNYKKSKSFNLPEVIHTGKSVLEVEPAGQTDKISVEDLKQLINKPELIKISEKHTPSHSLAFWILEGEMENIELEVEDGLRLKTLGDSPFIFSLAKMDAGTVTKCNFAGGEKVGTSWTDNVFAAKCKTEQEAKTCTQGEGVDEDEWND